MIPTNKHLPLPASRVPELSEVSGLASLDARTQRGGGAIAAGLLSLAFAAGIVAGGLITTALFIASRL